MVFSLFCDGIKVERTKKYKEVAVEYPSRSRWEKNWETERERKEEREESISRFIHLPPTHTPFYRSVVTLDRREWQMACASLDCASFSAIFKYSKTIIGVKRGVAWFRGWLIISRFRFCDYAFDSYISVKKWIVSNF